VEDAMLRRYENSLLTLINQIELMLKVEESKMDLETDKLKGIKPAERH
jgi:hypothetical protein